MEKITTYNPAIKFHEKYTWPDKHKKQNCPKCDSSMQLNKKTETFFGKPWWCSKCQWQFSEEELTG